MPRPTGGEPPARDGLHRLFREAATETVLRERLHHLFGFNTKGTLVEWGPANQKWTALKTRAVGGKGPIAAGGRVVAIATPDGQIRLWDVAKKSELRQM